MGKEYRTTPEPPEEPTERSVSDADESVTAVRRGAWVATSSLFGLAFLVVALMQVTRLFATASPYGGFGFVDGFVIGVVVLAFIAGLAVGRRELAAG